MRVRGQHHAPAALLSGKDPVPIVQEAGWTPRPVWTGAENLAPPPTPGFYPRTVHPAACRYTDWAIPAAFSLKEFRKTCVKVVTILSDFDFTNDEPSF